MVRYYCGNINISVQYSVGNYFENKYRVKIMYNSNQYLVIRCDTVPIGTVLTVRYDNLVCIYGTIFHP